jgi:hypothetical protein
MSMKAMTNAFALLLLLASSGSSAEEEPKIDRKPLNIAAMHEFGQLGKGIFKVGKQSSETLENEWIDHFGAFVTQEATVNDRLHISAGLGGVFQYRKPERVEGGFFGTQKGDFYIGPTKADAVYHFGETDKPWLKLGTGMFGYKYNPTAYNLGEYLFRSLPYPTVTNTGSYVLVGAAGANLQGFKANLDLGAFKADAFFLTETGYAPYFDWSLAAVASYSIADGLLELGGGVNFKRLLQVNPSRTAREVPENGYFSFEGKDYSFNTQHYTAAATWHNARNTAADSAIARTYEADKAVLDSVTTWIAFRKAGLPTSKTPPKIEYYSAAGTLLMGRFTLDIKKVLESDIFGPEDLKIYGEAALLGLKDYPVYYTKKSERMPIMLGFNIPTFKLLDLFAVQVEQMKSPWLNNTSSVGRLGANTPHIPAEEDLVLSEKTFNDMATKDDFKWTVLIQKKLGSHITLSGQAASDHMRMVSSVYFYGPQLDHNEVTATSDHWYWMFQVGWGI